MSLYYTFVKHTVWYKFHDHFILSLQLYKFKQRVLRVVCSCCKLTYMKTTYPYMYNVYLSTPIGKWIVLIPIWRGNWEPEVWGSWFIVMSSYFVRFRWRNSWSGFKIPVQSSSFCLLLSKNETYKTIDYIHMLVEIVGCNNKFRQLSCFNLAWINCSMSQWVRKMWRHRSDCHFYQLLLFFNQVLLHL